MQLLASDASLPPKFFGLGTFRLIRDNQTLRPSQHTCPQPAHQHTCGPAHPCVGGPTLPYLELGVNFNSTTSHNLRTKLIPFFQLISQPFNGDADFSSGRGLMVEALRLFPGNGHGIFCSL